MNIDNAIFDINTITDDDIEESFNKFSEIYKKIYDNVSEDNINLISRKYFNHFFEKFRKYAEILNLEPLQDADFISDDFIPDLSVYGSYSIYIENNKLIFMFYTSTNGKIIDLTWYNNYNEKKLQEVYNKIISTFNDLHTTLSEFKSYDHIKVADR